MAVRGLLSEKEQAAIRFYMGDLQTVLSGPFQGGADAYNTINALLHPRTENEKDKAREGRMVFLNDTDHLISYMTLIEDIYRSMVKYRRYVLKQTEEGSDEHSNTYGVNEAIPLTYRVDRASSIRRFVQDQYQISGFFSTSKRGLLPEYAQKKSRIVLLEVQRDASVPFLDFEDIFSDYYDKPEEAEILLPFGTVIREMNQLPLTMAEKTLYADMYGCEPMGKCRLFLTVPHFEEISLEEENQLYEEITEEETVGRVRESMMKLSAKQSLSINEEIFYNIWKEKLQRYIKGRCAKIDECGEN